MPTFHVPSLAGPADAGSLVANGIDWSSRQARGLETHIPCAGRQLDDIARGDNVGEIVIGGTPKRRSDFLDLDGSSDYLQLATSQATVGGDLIPTTGDFTISLWAMTRSGSTQQRILADANSSGGNTGYWLEFGALGTITFNWWISGQQTIFGPAYSANRWYHLVHARSGSRFEAWVNGVRVGTLTNAGAMYDSPSLTQYPALGRNGARTQRYLNGGVNGFRIYHRYVGRDLIVEMGREPQGLYVQPEEPIFFEDTGGGGSSVAPRYHHLKNLMAA